MARGRRRSHPCRPGYPPRRAPGVAPPRRTLPPRPRIHPEAKERLRSPEPGDRPPEKGVHHRRVEHRIGVENPSAPSDSPGTPRTPGLEVEELRTLRLPALLPGGCRRSHLRRPPSLRRGRPRPPLRTPEEHSVRQIWLARLARQEHRRVGPGEPVGRSRRAGQQPPAEAHRTAQAAANQAPPALESQVFPEGGIQPLPWCP